LKPEFFQGKNKNQIVDEIQDKLLDSYDVIREVVIENTSIESLHAIEREILLNTFDNN